jgi:hypothetical protein
MRLFALSSKLQSWRLEREMRRQESLKRSYRSALSRLNIVATLIAILCLFAFTAKGQERSVDDDDLRAANARSVSAAPSQTVVPVLKEYRKIAIGETVGAVKDVWGKPENEFPDQLLYELSDTESVQVVIDPDKKVTAIAVTFTDGKGAPAFAEVFGDSIMPEKRENGSVYRMVRYPGAGYWIAYYVGPGNNPSVSLTIQKL